MSLQHATLEQLLQWQQDIVHEIARRTQPAAPVAAPPWMMPPQPNAWAAPSPHWQPPLPVEPTRAPPVLVQESPEAMRIREQEEKIRAQHEGREPAHEVGRPLMRVTPKTDPAALAVFERTAPRAHDAPGRTGDGRGLGGAIDLGPAR